MLHRPSRLLPLACILWAAALPAAAQGLRELQTEAVENQHSPGMHWGPNADKYVSWSTHTNRLIPVYTFGTKGSGSGIDLDSYAGVNSAYRSEARLQELYGFVPLKTVAADADYLDQTDLFRIQKAALDAGKKHIVLVVFDGMDWQSTRAAAIAASGRVGYDAGRGTGLHFQDYAADGTSQFGFMVTSPHNEGTIVNVDKQSLKNPGGVLRGGYDIERGGPTPWEPSGDLLYPIAVAETPGVLHAYTDSASSATSMTSGAKTYNDSINVGPTGASLVPASQFAQQKSYAVGVVTSVPISHATPAAAYGQNVHRDDYQDLTRDLLGLPSVSHPIPLPGVDVLIGGGWGIDKKKDEPQGRNFVPGNRYLTTVDLEQSDAAHGGRYVVAQREAGVNGADSLKAAAQTAARKGSRLFGFYGADGGGSFAGNLPLRGAAGDFKPGPGWKTRDLAYTPADVAENPTLADMTAAALTVLEKNDAGFWLMVEAGDVDWANHDNNLDAAVGAVLSGDAAVKVVTDWVETHGGWDDAVLIVTADHGHYLVIDEPQALLPPQAAKSSP